MSRTAKRFIQAINAIRSQNMLGRGAAYPVYVAAAQKIAAQLIGKGC